MLSTLSYCWIYGNSILRNSIEKVKELYLKEFPGDISSEVATILWYNCVLATEPVLSDDLIIDMMRKNIKEKTESDGDDERANADDLV